MITLKHVLERLLKENPAYQELETRQQVFESWSQIVGEKNAKHCWPVKLTDEKILIIASVSSAWLQTMKFMETQILDRYKNKVGKDIVVGLRFKLQTKRDL